ncbi:putative tRNA sulfurtransferase [Paenibacillus baekrokdamisoli]|uniref:Probable tRNA sulfurtransferase n=1 Tax=Paenibacillus baekrokdamisoli TaxID=1712516 RepID=A0A3G9IYN2_9BACL|nr:tRNA uracil 4-sulfurtransferase ThiI [Paenibacillus baekrokdamisoli]MBB3070250.1 thiamine biosynthesis protein ThiI [Paenibacillus baekrokdamisoli]BBH21255.1 putative tRNA sulfurtransferase [Paenibacillus baekrokdamisoli]
MKPDLIIIRFGEYMVKGRNRRQFEKRMEQQIKRVLVPFPGTIMSHAYGRIYITLHDESYDAIAKQLSLIFGIHSFSPVKRTANELEAIRAAALDLMTTLPQEPGTFKVSVRRVQKDFPHDSQEMNHLVGSHVLRAIPNLKVKVKEPDVELRVEIQPEGTYVFNEVVQGAGGYPYGTNGKAMLLLSGGIDSPVAGYLSMRQGLEIEAIHFHSYPFTSEKAKDKVIDLARRLSHFSGVPIKLHLVSFTDIQTAFAQSNQETLVITLMRRAMLRIAQRLAEQSWALGLVTGDSLGQVASQTLGSMNVIGRTVELPLLRPLIMTDKNEIIRIAKQIGTYETSILPFEDCCTLFVPKSPSTNPNLKIVQRVESSIQTLDAMIDEAVATAEIIELRSESVNVQEDDGSEEWF